MARAGRLAGRTGGEPAREHMRGRRAWDIWGREHWGPGTFARPGGFPPSRRQPARPAEVPLARRRSAARGQARRAGRFRRPRARPSGPRRALALPGSGRGRHAAARPHPEDPERRAGRPAAAAARLRRPERGGQNEAGQNEVERSRGPIEARPSRAGRMMPADGSGRAFGLARSALCVRPCAFGLVRSASCVRPCGPALPEGRRRAPPSCACGLPLPPPPLPPRRCRRPPARACRPKGASRRGRAWRPSAPASGPGLGHSPPVLAALLPGMFPRRGTPHAAAILRTPPAAGMRFRAPMPALPPRRRPRRPPQNRAAGGPPQAGSTASRLASLSAISVSSSSVCDSSSSVCSRSAAASFSPSCRAHCRSVP